jgi:hypothetical protein
MDQFYTVGPDFWWLMLAAYLALLLIARESRLVRAGAARREDLVLFCMLAATTSIACFAGDLFLWIFDI